MSLFNGWCWACEMAASANRIIVNTTRGVAHRARGGTQSEGWHTERGVIHSVCHWTHTEHTTHGVVRTALCCWKVSWSLWRSWQSQSQESAKRRVRFSTAVWKSKTRARVLSTSLAHRNKNNSLRRRERKCKQRSLNMKWRGSRHI